MIEMHSKKETFKERERHTQTDRHTDRYRETDRQLDTEREIDRDSERHTERSTQTLIQMQACSASLFSCKHQRERNVSVNKMGRHTYMYMPALCYRKTRDRQARQTDIIMRRNVKTDRRGM